MGPHLLRPGQTIMLGEKITLSYEALGFDPNATLVGVAGGAPSPQETYRVAPGMSTPLPRRRRRPCRSAQPPVYAPPDPPRRPIQPAAPV